MAKEMVLKNTEIEIEVDHEKPETITINGVAYATGFFRVIAGAGVEWPSDYCLKIRKRGEIVEFKKLQGRHEGVSRHCRR